MALSGLRKYLNNNKIKYSTLSHSQVFTSQETAASAHISGNELAKTVIIKVDGNMAMAVLPASSQPGRELPNMTHFGVYQIGDVYARSWVVIGTSLDVLTPKYAAS